jgi:valyl-tRNA synthetase
MENEDCRRRKGVVVLRETPRECPYCGSLKLVQDEDVLDTWFSSSLWPFSTLGWPDETADLRTFYPTSVLVTGFDILFFWVARMSMMGIKFMEAVPFRDVYIHALVRDSKGQKMSKSKGNVVDPLIMIEKYGADAFRFSLAAFAAQGRDIRFSEERVEGYRYFVNKLWNAARFVMMNAEAAGVAADVRQSGLRAVKDLAGRWVLSRLAATTEEVNKALGDYRFNDAASSIYQFIWHEFCDWYIEMSKDALYSDAGDKAETISCLLSVLDSSLRLLHPFMPFVTEEVWQSIGKAGEKSGESIVISPYPTDLPRDHDAEEEMFYLMEAVVGIRNVRGEMNISPGLEVRAFVRTFTDRASEVLMENSSFIKRLARVTEMTIGRGIERPKGAATAVKDSFEIYVPLEGLLNITAEIDRLMKEKKKVEESLGLLERKMMNDDFLKRAPRDIVEKEKAKHQELMQRDERLELGIQRLKEVEVKNG